MAILESVEDFGHDACEKKYVKVLFSTDYKGYYQYCCTERDFGRGREEPPLHSLKETDQKEIKRVSAIIYYFTHGELPEDLSVFDT